MDGATIQPSSHLGGAGLRQAIARRHSELTGQQGVDESNCALFSDAQNALFAAAQCVLEQGNEAFLIQTNKIGLFAEAVYFEGMIILPSS